MSDNQTSFATLGSPIGFFSQVSGTVIVRSLDGKERVVHVGDPIYYGETVITGSSDSATISFVDGTQVVIGGESIVEMNDEVYTPGDTSTLAQDSSTDANSLQQAILAGQDPTLIQDAPAAGNEVIVSEQSADIVTVERLNETATPTYGYDTNNSFTSSTGGNDTTSTPSRDRAASVISVAGTTTGDASSTVVNVARVADSSATEGQNVSFGVTLSAATATVQTFTLTLSNITTSSADLSASGITFTNGVVNNNNGTITVPAGVTNFTANVPTVNDTANESNETFTLAIGGISGTGTIIDNDVSRPVITLAPSSDTGNSSTDDLTNDTTSTFNLTNVDSDASTVEVFKGTTKLGNATQDANSNWTFTASNGQLTEGANSLTVKVTDTGGNTATSNPLTVTLDTVASASITVNPIAGDDVLDAVEAAGTVVISGTVSGDAAVGDTVTLSINGNNSQYSGLVSAAANGSLIYSINVDGKDLVGNSRVQASVSGSDAAGNTFNVTSSPSDGIYQDKSQVIASLDDGKGFTPEGDNAVFTLSLNQVASDDVTVKLTTNFITAGANDIGTMTASYVDGKGQTQSLVINADGTLTIPAGVTNVALTVPTIDDSISEGNEKFSVHVDGVTGVTANDTATTTIMDNDGEPKISSISSAVNANGGAVEEGDTATFTVSLSNASSTAQTYSFSLGGSGDSATKGTDYSNSVAFSNGVSLSTDGKSLTVPAGVTTFTATVQTIDDTVHETNETFTLNVGGQSGVATIIDNDVLAPTVTITTDGNNDGYISKAELKDDIDVKVSLPAGTVAGDTITVTDGHAPQSITLTTTEISAGFVTASFANPGEGKTINISATLTDQHGNTSDAGTDSAIIDTTIDSNGNGETVSIDAMTEDTGSSNSDFISNDTTPVISGQYDAADGTLSVVVKDAAGKDVAGTLSTDTDKGTWTFTPA
ncbi:retention module-containing protein, partial [Marinomonas spartinae]|uniref:retention module-containing protein n=1 Tax=Marinomonas spartinae TaxID=1792290 RepID=UPI000A61E2FD